MSLREGWEASLLLHSRPSELYRDVDSGRQTGRMTKSV